MSPHRERMDCFTALAMTTRIAHSRDPLGRNDDRGDPALPDRLQPRLDRRTSRFEEWRQRQFFTKRRQRLVGSKARAVGCNLEQDAVGLAKIEAAKIEPVDLAA